MKSIIQSIKPQRCELIASGRMKINVMKTRPKLQTPFKVYIYETKTGYVSRSKENDILVPVKYRGKCIGEYVCDEIIEWTEDMKPPVPLDKIQLSYSEIRKYGRDKTLYLWHISDLKIYDKPKELSKFFVIDKEFLKDCPYRIRTYNNPDYTNGALLLGSYACNNSFEPDFCRGQCGGATKPLFRPPQSWCYVEEVG